MTRIQWVAIIVLAIAYFGSEYYKATNPALTQLTCINGVSYLLFYNGVSVEYTPEGKVRTCGTSEGSSAQQ